MRPLTVRQTRGRLSPLQLGPRYSQRSRRKGQNLVEGAFVMTLLMMLTLGAVQFAVILNAVMVLQHATRSTARYAAVHCFDLTTSQLQDHLQLMLQGTIVQQIDVPDSAINITYPGAEGKISGQTVCVQVQYNLSKKVFVPQIAGVKKFMETYSISSSQVIE